MNPRLLAKKLIVLVATADTRSAAERFSLACRINLGRPPTLFWDSIHYYPDRLAMAMVDLADIVGAPSLLVASIPGRLEQWLWYGREPDSAVLYVPADLGSRVYDISSYGDWAMPLHLPDERRLPHRPSAAKPAPNFAVST